MAFDPDAGDKDLVVDPGFFEPVGQRKSAAVCEDEPVVGLREVLVERLRIDGELGDVLSKHAEAMSPGSEDVEALAGMLDKLAVAMKSREDGDASFVEGLRESLEKQAALLGRKAPGVLERIRTAFAPAPAKAQMRALQEQKAIAALKLELEMLQRARKHVRAQPVGVPEELPAGLTMGGIVPFVKEHPLVAGGVAGGIGAVALEKARKRD